MASMGDASGPMPAIQDMRAPRVCYHLKKENKKKRKKKKEE